MSTQGIPPHIARASYYGGLGPTLVGVSWSLFAVATILLGLRIVTYTAIVKNRGGCSLAMACVAWCIGALTTALYTLGVSNGLGNHLTLVAMNPSLPNALLSVHIATCTLEFSVGFAKLGAMFYILDIQQRTHQAGRWAMFISIGVNFVCYIVSVPLIFTQCSPFSKLWKPMLPGECEGRYRAYAFGMFIGAWGAATDLLLALYPVALVYSLRIKLRIKLTLCFLMGLGIFTAVCSLMKTVKTQTLQAAADTTYETGPLYLWAVTEMWVVLITSSVAPIWPLLRQSASHFTCSKKTTSDQTVFSRNHFGAAAVFSRGEGNTYNSKNPRLNSSSNDLRAAILRSGAIEMTREFTVSEMQRPEVDELVESEVYGTVCRSTSCARN